MALAVTLELPGNIPYSRTTGTKAVRLKDQSTPVPNKMVWLVALAVERLGMVLVFDMVSSKEYPTPTQALFFPVR